MSDEDARLTERLRESTRRAREFLDLREKYRVGRLMCVECGLVAEGWRATQGWTAYLDPDGDGIHVFCADCDEREFGDAR